MKLPWLLFALLLGMCAVVAAAFLIEEVPSIEKPAETGQGTVKEYLGHGFTHAEFETMNAAGPGAERHEKVLWLAWAFGMLEIVFFLTCLAFGGRKAGKVGPLARPIVIGGVVYAAVFTLMVLSYRGYMNEDTHALFLGFPQPTAWMLYGLWVFPFFFLLLYIFIFDRWTFTDEDLARFHEILAQRRANEADES